MRVARGAARRDPSARVPRHVARLHLQTYLALPSPTNPSRQRARALLSSQLSIRDARGLLEELVDSLDDTRTAAGWVLLGDALTFSDPGEARSAYEHARTVDPSSVDARLGLVRLLSSMALFDAALEVAMDVLGRPREAGDRAREAVHVGRVRLRLGAHLVAVAAAVLRVAAAHAVDGRSEDEAAAAA